MFHARRTFRWEVDLRPAGSPRAQRHGKSDSDLELTRHPHYVLQLMEEPEHSAMGSRTAAASPASLRTPSGMGSWILLIFFTFFVVYPASIGPSIVLYNRSNNPTTQAIIVAIYRPVLYVCDKFRPAEKVMEAYAEWWRPKD